MWNERAEGGGRMTDDRGQISRLRRPRARPRARRRPSSPIKFWGMVLSSAILLGFADSTKMAGK
jgi:hypothetical protein